MKLHKADDHTPLRVGACDAPSTAAVFTITTISLFIAYVTTIDGGIYVKLKECHYPQIIRPRDQCSLWSRDLRAAYLAGANVQGMQVIQTAHGGNRPGVVVLRPDIPTEHVRQTAVPLEPL